MKHFLLYRKFLLIIVPLLLIMVVLSIARFEYKAEIVSELTGDVYDEAYLFLLNESLFDPNDGDQKLEIRDLQEGLSDNKNYKISIFTSGGSKHFFLKIFDQDILESERLITLYAVDYAYYRGVGPKVYYKSRNHDFFIRDYVGAETLNIENVHKKEVLKEVATALRRIHKFNPEGFQYRFRLNDATNKMNWYVRDKPLLWKKFNDQYQFFLRIDSLIKQHIPMRVTHNDIHDGNIILSEGRVYIIDWESIAISNPYMDLVSFMLKSDLTKGERDLFLKFYFKRESTAQEKALTLLSEQIYYFQRAIKLYYASYMDPRFSVNYPSEGELLKVLNDPQFNLAALRSAYPPDELDRIRQKDVDVRLRLSLAHLKKFIENVQSEKFKEAVRLLR